MTVDLSSLNSKQVEAVKTIAGPVLIIAGPGSGKTRCLTYRIAYMISSGIKPENILAVTFTNKSAQEVEERVQKLLRGNGKWQIGTPLPFMGTFHSICLRILRRNIDKIGYQRNFVIYDEDDQLALIKRVMTDLDISTKKFNPAGMLAKISGLKSELIEPEKFSSGTKEYAQKILALIYTSYQLALKKSNAVDFDDLIMLCVNLFGKRADVLAKYQEIFKYILVDEFQDTNTSQYILLKLLASRYRNLFSIGDDAQSIFLWRGADFRNILNFEKDYPEAKVVKLEQNYRSTKNILAAANGVILNNKNQKLKKLWTENPVGKPIVLKELQDEKEEGEFIIQTIQSAVQGGVPLKDFAILYRTHAQSRTLEEAMIRRGFPYQLIGGVKFYQRREIKDVLAYLRLALNQTDELSLTRIYNVPPRGIGQSSYKKLRRGDLNIGSKQLIAFKELQEFLNGLKQKSTEIQLTKLARQIIEKTNYQNYLLGSGPDGRERWENVQELFTAMVKYDRQSPPVGLEKFLEEATLIQNIDQLEEKENVIKMMTLHSAKGLEFPEVFIVGLEEGIFPHASSLFEPRELEEERRLCYVGLTRAKRQLHLTFCRHRNLFGRSQKNHPSRFLFEIPESLLKFRSRYQSSLMTESTGHPDDEENVIDYV